MKDLRAISTVILLISLFITAGCAIHKSKVSGNMVEVPRSYESKIDTDITLSLTGKWWEEFEDELLNALVEESLRNNLDIQIAIERLNQLKAITDINRSFLFPSVNIEVSGEKARRSNVRTDTYSLSVAAGYEVDFWGKVRYGIEASKLDALATEEDIKTLYMNISAQVADLYFLALEQRAQIELSDKTIESFKNTLEFVESRYKAGLVPALDVYQSRQNLTAALAQRPVFESRLITTLNALSLLLGRYPKTDVAGESKNLPEIQPFETGIPSQLLKDRPDIKAAFLRIKSSDQRIGAAVADRFPSFNLIGNYGRSSDDIKTLLDSPNILWNLIIQAAMPIIDGGRRRAEVDRTHSVFRENLAVYHKTVLNAFKDVDNALVKNKTTEERIRYLSDRVDATSASVRLSLDRYMQGLSDYLPILAAQGSNFEAQSLLLSARRQLISDRISLARALGGKWIDEEWNDRISEDKVKGKGS